MAGVQEYTDKNSLDYVGHSNGGRVALSSLHEYSTSGKNNAGYFFNYSNGQYDSMDLKANPVDIFVGVAVPATLNDETLFTTKAREPYILCTGYTGCFTANNHTGDYTIKLLNSSGKYHINLKNYAKHLHPVGNILLDDGKLSLNLMKFYNDLAIEEDSNIDFSNVDVNEIYLFNGDPDDKVLGLPDQTKILDSVGYGTGKNYTAGNIFTGDLFGLRNSHAAIIKMFDLKKDIREVLKNG